MSLKSGHSEVRVYEAQSALREPLKLLRSIFRDLFGSRQLAFTLAVRDVKAQYRQSILGLAWMVLPPLFFTVGMTVLQRNNVLSLKGPEGIPFPAYVLVGSSLWQMFMSALNGPITALMSGKGILTRVNFPRETLLVAELYKILFNVSVQLVLILVTLLWFRIIPGATILLFPLALGALLLLGTMFGIFLAPIALLYKDVSNALPIVGYIWMVLTPVLMSVNDLAPGGLYATVVRFNPVTPVLVISREFLTGLPVTHQYSSLGVLGCTLVGLIIALLYFRVAMPMVIERWSS
jgi:lipopolysaccharide transport system permease protein